MFFLVLVLLVFLVLFFLVLVVLVTLVLWFYIDWKACDRLSSLRSKGQRKHVSVMSRRELPLDVQQMLREYLVGHSA